MVHDCVNLVLFLINEIFGEDYTDEEVVFQPNDLAGSVPTVNFPHSAWLYLRSTVNTPDVMTIRLVTPGSEVSYKVKVMKIKNPTVLIIYLLRNSHKYMSMRVYPKKVAAMLG